MIRTSSLRAVVSTTVAFGALCAGAGVANADGFSQTNLVSNIPGLATATDSSLVNPWGVSFANGSPVWISDQGTQTTPLFSVTGSTSVSNQPLFTVNIPPAGASGPTGQVANGMGMGFDVGNGGNGKSANFIFANLDGSISAWDNSPHTQAITQTSVAGASFTGLAINQADTELFAANTAGARIDAFNNSFQLISTNLRSRPRRRSARRTRPLQRDRSWRQRIRNLRAVRPRAPDNGHGGPGRRRGIQRERRT